MSSDEDDFMSDKFLAKQADHRPGLATSYNDRRKLAIEKNRWEIQNRKVKTLKDIEIEKREEALRKPVSEESKGFQMLAKMGFKPGMTLGKKKDENDMGSGITEPVPLLLKVDRTGLGHATAEDEKTRKRVADAMDRMAARAKISDQLGEEFRDRRREDALKRQLVKAIVRARKTCVQLDMKTQRELPDTEWFWPSYYVKEDEASASKPQSVDEVLDAQVKRSRGLYRDEVVQQFVYFNGKPAPPDIGFDELEVPDLRRRLGRIVKYMRSEHSYCLGCGVAMSPEELEAACDGDHDEADYVEH